VPVPPFDAKKDFPPPTPIPTAPEVKADARGVPETKADNKGLPPTEGNPLPSPTAIGIEPKTPPLPVVPIEIKPPVPADPRAVGAEGTHPPLPTLPTTPSTPESIAAKDSTFTPTKLTPTPAPTPLVPVPAPPTPGTPEPFPAPPPLADKPTAPPVIIPASRTETPAPQGTSYQAYTYTVQSGDTYATLSQRFYGDAKYARALEEWLKSKGPAQETIKASNLVPNSSILIPQQAEVLRAKYPGLVP
jgi:hypothetical protein